MPRTCIFKTSAVLFFLLKSANFVSASYDVSDKILFPPMPNAAPRSDNIICRAESQQYIESLDNMTLWAHKMWDATAKISVGVLQGSTFNFGNFDECLSTSGPFRTQYCLITMNAQIPDKYSRSDPYNLEFRPNDHVLTRLYKTNDVSQQSRNTIKVGWCIPASCTAIDLQRSLNQYLKTTAHPFNTFNVTYSAEVNEKHCQREKEGRLFDAVDISFCILSGILVALVILGSIWDWNTSEAQSKTSSLFRQIICAFSFQKSYYEIQRADESNASLRVLYGIRTVAIMMIVMDHRFGTYISGPIENFDYIEREYRSVSAWFLFHGDLFVDTFFILSGTLVAYGLLRQYDKKYINPLVIIVLRYIRLTPAYAFAIFFWSSIFRHIGSGPLWNVVVQKEVEDCRKYWWTNLLYISNYIGGPNMCMIHSWYLPCDFHYFIIAIFVIKILHHSKKAGFTLMGILYIVSVAVPFTITYLYQRPGLLYFYPEFLVDPKGHPDYILSYTKSHTRGSTYIIGMCAGYGFYKLKNEECKLSRLNSFAILMLSMLLLLGGMSSGAIFYDPYHEYHRLEAASYAAFHRTLWGLGTIGVMFVSAYGHPLALYKVLTWLPCIPLGKLVFGVYLIHMLFQLRAVGMATSPRHFNYFNTISYGLSDIALAFAFSFLLFVAIENPFRKIIKLLLFPERPKQITISQTAMPTTQSEHDPAIPAFSTSRL